MFTGLQGDHLKLVATYWIRFSLRTGGGLMALLVILIVGLTLASFIVTPVEALMAKSPELGHTEGDTAAFIDEVTTSDVVVGLVKEMTGAEEPQVEYLLKEQPALLSAIWVLLLLLFPFMSCISAFNQTAGDIGSRGLRYLLLRTERVNVFFGRFLGTLIFAAVSTAIMMTMLIVYIGIKFNIYPLLDLISWGLQGYVAFMLLSLAYIALCSWMSAALDSAFGSLALCLVLVGFPIAVFKMADWGAHGIDLAWLTRLLPWGWKYDLLAADIGARLLAYGVMLGFTAVFLLLGLRTFSKRDL